MMMAILMTDFSQLSIDRIGGYDDGVDDHDHDV